MRRSAVWTDIEACRDEIQLAKQKAKSSIPRKDKDAFRLWTVNRRRLIKELLPQLEATVESYMVELLWFFSRDTTLLDPCAGTGTMLARLAAENANCRTFWMEEDTSLHPAIADRLADPISRVELSRVEKLDMGAPFLECDVSAWSFGGIVMAPVRDHEAYLEKAVGALGEWGRMIALVPEKVIRKKSVQALLDSYYSDAVEVRGGFVVRTIKYRSPAKVPHFEIKTEDGHTSVHSMYSIAMAELDQYVEICESMKADGYMLTQRCMRDGKIERVMVTRVENSHHRGSWR